MEFWLPFWFGTKFANTNVLKFQFFDYFLQRYSGMRGLKVDPGVYKLLMNYDWPGNVRELQNLVERVVARARGATITSEDIPREIIHTEELKVDNTDNFYLQV